MGTRPFYTLDAPGEKGVVLGNEALARGVFEAGVAVAAAYPGTPSTETMETLAEIWQYYKDFHLEWSTNEAVAFQVALGASMCNARAFACMKHVGVNVAADGFITANYAGAHGGLVLLSADDPNCYSSQNEQDNRYYGLHAYCPVFEAMNIQEAKDVLKYAFEFSEKFQSIVMMRTTTRLNHARGDLVLGERETYFNRVNDFDGDRHRWTFLPSNARVQRVKMLERFEKIRDFSNEFPFTWLEIKDETKIGIISSGVPYSYLHDALVNLGMLEKVSILKLGMVHPLPEKLIMSLMENVDRLLVVEELEPFIEDQVKRLAYENDLSIEISGKKYFSMVGELNLTKTVDGLTRFLDMPNPFAGVRVDTNDMHRASPRPPVLCAGCPHRSTFYAIKLVEKETGKKFVYSGDIGCYTLGFYKPIDAIDTCICMGASIGLANGISKLHDGPVFAFLGDSTFFHTGIPGLVDAVYNQNDIITCILDNSVTAMTGFQPHPGTGILITGEPGVKIPLEQIVLGAGVKEENLWVVDAHDLSAVTKAVREAVAASGPRVIISRQPCSLYDRKTNKKKKITPVVIDKSACTECMICVKSLGCPAISLSEDDEVTIIETRCTGCNACVQVCPTNAISPREE